MHPSDRSSGNTVVPLSLLRNEEYDLRLTDILRKRRRPLFLIMNSAGELQSCSLPDSGPASEQRLIGQALAEARPLVQSHFENAELGNGDCAAPDRQRVALIIQDSAVYIVRLISLYPSVSTPTDDQYAVVVEPIAGPLTDGIDFAAIKKRFRLSNRELDVLVALMTGTRDKEIARVLDVSAGTVRAYLKSVRAKLGVTTRTGIVNLVHEVSGKSGSTQVKSGSIRENEGS